MTSRTTAAANDEPDTGQDGGTTTSKGKGVVVATAPGYVLNLPDVKDADGNPAVITEDGVSLSAKDADAARKAAEELDIPLIDEKGDN